MFDFSLIYLNKLKIIIKICLYIYILKPKVKDGWTNKFYSAGRWESREKWRKTGLKEEFFYKTTTVGVTSENSLWNYDANSENVIARYKQVKK
jgi:hypothetical protein